ncbi:MAG: phosphatidylglycerophosphate synthase, partial [Clostridia bacterium]|nr:phosphatidylglycerophosphate synthase [Clostridia bacterium]
LPKSIWVLVAFILIIRSLSYLTAAIRYKSFASLHTYLNKATGSVLFAVPYFLNLPFANAYCWFICIIALAASTEELLMHLMTKQYTANIKTIWAIQRHD